MVHPDSSRASSRPGLALGEVGVEQALVDRADQDHLGFARWIFWCALASLHARHSSVDVDETLLQPFFDAQIHFVGGESTDFA